MTEQELLRRCQAAELVFILFVVDQSKLSTPRHIIEWRRTVRQQSKGVPHHLKSHQRLIPLILAISAWNGPLNLCRPRTEPLQFLFLSMRDSSDLWYKRKALWQLDNTEIGWTTDEFSGAFSSCILILLIVQSKMKSSSIARTLSRSRLRCRPCLRKPHWFMPCDKMTRASWMFHSTTSARRGKQRLSSTVNGI